MAYFPAAFKKVLISRGGHNTALPLEQLSAGMFGFFDAKTWVPVDTPNATRAQHPKVVLAVANPYHTVGDDKQGPYGGYTESVKSQVIDPRSISRFWKVMPRSAQPQSVYLGWNGSDYDLTPIFYCGKTYQLRLDVKGSPVLRFLGHPLSKRLLVTTDCCANPANPQQLDPNVVMLEFARQINEDPLLSPFLFAQVMSEDWDTGNPIILDPHTYVPFTSQDDIPYVPSGLQLLVQSSESVFEFCSFDPRDYYEAEPLILTSAQWVNDDGQVCPDLKPLPLTEQTAPLTAEGTPDSILRDLLTSLNYRQEFYSNDARIREIREMQKIVGDVKSAYRFVSYYILHSVPRRNNPTGIHNNDQYLIQLVFLDGDVDSRTYLEAWMASYLASAATGVKLEDLSGKPDPE